MALAIFKATAIFWQNGRYVFNEPDNVIDLNGAQLAAYSPRQCWLLRYLVPGTNQIQYQLTFTPSSADLSDANTIAGLWVEGVGGTDVKGVMIDCISVDDFNLAANGTNANLQRRYGAAPAFTTPSAACWRITRADAGTAAAHGKVSTDYVGQYVGNVRLVSNISGVSVYEVTAYGTLVAIGTDSVATC